MSSLEILRSSAAFYDVSPRGRLRLTGEDRKRLLHALSTNHIQEMTPGDTRPAYFLSAQGRILGLADIVDAGEALLLSVEPETRARLAAHIDRYIIADDATIADVTEDTCEIAVEGLPDFTFDSVKISSSLTGQSGFRLVVPTSSREALLDALKSAGAVEVSMAAVHALRVANGVARYGEDITEAHLVQETHRMAPVHANKGCYLGQEIVERVRARGHVNRQLVRLQIGAPSAPPAGEKVLSGETETGEITSAALTPEGVFALAYVKAPHARPGTALTVAAAPASVL